MARCAMRAGGSSCVLPALGIAVVAVCIGLGAGAGRAWAQSVTPRDALVVKTDSLESIREVYRELGFEFDDAASQARFEELQDDCLFRGSRRFGNILRPIRFVGLAYRSDDPDHKLTPVCHAIRPYDDNRARELCESIDRPLVENRIFEMLVICGKKGTIPQPPTDSTGRRLGDWP